MYLVTAIDYVNKVLELLRKQYAGTATRLSTSELKSPFGRQGVCVTLVENPTETDKEFIDQWLNSNKLREQLGLNESNKLTQNETNSQGWPTYAKDDNQDFYLDNQENPFQKRLKKKDSDEYINDFAQELDQLFTIYTKAFSKSTISNPKKKRINASMIYVIL